jgi:WD40 repeat protein
VKVFDRATGERFRDIPLFAPVMAVAVSSISSLLLAISYEGSAQLVRLDSAQPIRHFDARAGTISCGTLSSDGRLLALGGARPILSANGPPGFARVYAVGSDNELLTIGHDSPVEEIALSANGEWLATVTSNTVHIFGVKNGALHGTFTHQDRVDEIVFSADGRLLGTRSSDGTARVFDVAEGKELARLSRGRTIEAVAFDPIENTFAISSSDGIYVYPNVSTDPDVITYAADVHAAVYSPDNRFIAVAENGDSLRLLDDSSNRELRRIAYKVNVNALSFSPSGTLLAAGGADEHIRTFRTSDGGAAESFETWAAVNALAYSDNGRFLVAAGGAPYEAESSVDSGYAIVLDAASMKEVSEVSYPHALTAVALSSDGRIIATGDERGVVELYDRLTSHRRRLFAGELVVHSIHFSRDKRSIIVAGDDTAVRIIDIVTRQVKVFKHPEAVNNAVFSPDGHIIATGCEDGRVRVFDVASSDEIAGIPTGAAVISVAFSSDGRRLLISSGTHLIRAPWRVEDVLVHACQRLQAI